MMLITLLINRDLVAEEMEFGQGWNSPSPTNLKLNEYL